MDRYISSAWMPQYTVWLDAQPDNDFNRRMDRLEALDYEGALDKEREDDYLDRSARSYAKCPGLHTDADQKYIPFRDDEDAPLALRDMEEW